MNKLSVKSKHVTSTLPSTQNMGAAATADCSPIRLKGLQKGLYSVPQVHQWGMIDFDRMPDSGFVRLSSLVILFACSRATVWRWVRSGKLPAPKKLGPRVTAWNVGELRQVLSACMKGELA